METLPLIFLSFLGLCAGSFAYAMTLRMYDGRDWVKGRSECDMSVSGPTRRILLALPARVQSGAQSNMDGSQWEHRKEAN